MNALAYALHREYLLLLRDKSILILPLLFGLMLLVVLVLLLSPAVAAQATVGGGLCWLITLLVIVLLQQQWFRNDFNTGSLQQQILDNNLFCTLLARYLLYVLSLLVILTIQVFMAVLLLHLQIIVAKILLLTMVFGVPTLLSLGMLCAALSLTQRAGSGLIYLLWLPLCVPVLITIAVITQWGVHCIAWLSLLVAQLLFAVAICFPITLRILRIVVAESI